jgi:outer membrane protein TolC
VSRSRLNTAGLGAAVLALGLAGCAHYAPAPPHLERYPAALAERRLDNTPPGGVWRGADLLAVAVAQNPQIAEARSKYATALAAVRAARAPPGPSLTLTAEYANETPHWGYSGASNIPLDYGARRSTRITTAELQALQAFYDLGEAIWSVRTDLEKARGDRLSASSEIGLAEQSVTLRRQRWERLERRVAAGQDAQSVAITALGDLTAAERRLAAAQGRLSAANVSLAKALAVNPAAVQSLTLAAPAGSVSMADLAAWRNEAALSRRDVLRAVADYDIAENALRLQVAMQYPAVSLGPAYNYDHGVTKWPFSLALALPPWDLNRGPIAQAEAARAAAGRTLELTQANALAAVDAAAAVLATARDDLARTRTRDLPAANRTLAAATRATNAGQADRTDELAAQAAKIDTELGLNDAEHAAAAAAADLEDALRRSFDPAETALIEAAMAKGRGAK